MSTQTDVATTIRGLLEERRGYEVAANKDRIAQVDAELARLGHQATPPAQRAAKRAPAKKA